MKKRVFLTAILSLVMCSSSVNAFDGPTHIYVTERALEIFAQVFGTEYDEIFTPENKAIIIQYCVMPDEDERDGAFSQHFFNLATQKNFKGTEDSALERLASHFYNAIDHYLSGNREMAMQELARAVHFLEDLSTPVHTYTLSPVDAGKKLPSHMGFENTCKAVQKHCVSEMIPLEFDDYNYNNIKQIGFSCAYRASQNYEALHQHKPFCPNKEQRREKAAKNSIMQAQKDVAGVLYKFCLKVSEQKVNPFC